MINRKIKKNGHYQDHSLLLGKKRNITRGNLIPDLIRQRKKENKIMLNKNMMDKRSIINKNHGLQIRREMMGEIIKTTDISKTIIIIIAIIKAIIMH